MTTEQVQGTGIQWTWVPGYKGETWNPTTGCTRVSPGCDNCYAFQLHDQRHVAWKRGRWETAPEQYRKPFSQVQLLPQRLQDPLHAKKPRAYFVDSMADLFHEDVPDEYLGRVFKTMADSPQHLFLILTKRPVRMRSAALTFDVWGAKHGIPWPLPNVWLGISAEDQERYDERWPVLADTPAAVRFVSAEPLLGPLLLSYGTTPDWVLIGGESGRHARPFNLDWARGLIRDCREVGAAPFMKQTGARVLSDGNPRSVRRWILSDGEALGEWVPPVIGPLAHVRPDNAVGYVPNHNHGGNPNEWPEDLRVREWPSRA